MKGNPYYKDIIAIPILGFLLLAIETWRRLDNLFSYAYFDDVWLVALAYISTYLLYRRQYIGQLLWLFTCGCGFCMITGSFFSALEHMDQADASGFSMSTVLLVKGLIYLVITLLSIRAFQQLLRYRFAKDTTCDLQID